MTTDEHLPFAQGVRQERARSVNPKQLEASKGETCFEFPLRWPGSLIIAYAVMESYKFDTVISTTKIRSLTQLS